jgi:hypothetical protein
MTANGTTVQSTRMPGSKNGATRSSPPAVEDPKVPQDDLMLEFRVRIWGREREVFKQSRTVNIWKGALPSGTYRVLASSDITGQLEHLLRTVKVELNQYVSEVDRPEQRHSQQPLATTFDASAFLGLSADFDENDATPKMPYLDQ